ncbi:MAG: hypothetical protein MSG64_14640 [Pyrinomonadaceae bacterium MAG19_C2-C3]|nr:hypothetical protein [Pyrinomonadaceae bacterium MAG19_C2-C3]
MEQHPIRERIYLPVTKFGVPHTDWKWILILTMAAFVLPFILNIWIFNFPASTFTGLSTLGASVLFFNLVRYGRRPYWFNHKLKALLTHHWQQRALPEDELNVSWIKNAPALEARVQSR